MKYSLVIGIILLNIITGTNTMEEKPKKKYNIKLSLLGKATLPKPVDTPHKRPSPNTDKALEEARKKEEIPHKMPSPRITKEEERK